MTLYVALFMTVTLIAASLGLCVFLDSRGICFFGGNMATDNEKMLKVASQFRLSFWPRASSVPYGRGQLREFW